MNNPDGQTVPELVPHLEPLCDVLRELTDAAQELPPASGLPSAESKAMAERAEEAPFTNEHWTEPVVSCHSVAGVMRFSTTDHVRNYGRLFHSEPVPVYSHLVLARAALDACGMTWWLSEANIETRTRAMRYHTSRLMNAEQLGQSPVATIKADAKKIQANVSAGASANGWTISKKRARVGTEEKPRPKKLIRTVLSDDAIFGEDGIGIGDLLWWYLSGATHSASYALMQSVQFAAPEANPAGGESMGEIYTNGTSVLLMGLTVARAYNVSVAEHALLMGWESERWTAAQKMLADFAATQT